MLHYVETRQGGSRIVIDGYSTCKYMTNAIKEIGKWIAENVDEDEGRMIVKYKKESLAKNAMNGEYFFEIEDVPCASSFNEEKDEMEYKEGNWYFCIGLVGINH